MDLIGAWLSCLTVLVLVALFRKRKTEIKEIKYEGDYIHQYELTPWNYNDFIEGYLLKNTEFLHAIIDQINKLQVKSGTNIKED